MCICPAAGDARLWVTVTESIFVVLLKESVAVPVAAELLAGTSFAPFKVALKVVTLGPSSFLLQEVIANTKIEIAKNRSKFFIYNELMLVFNKIIKSLLNFNFI